MLRILGFFRFKLIALFLIFLRLRQAFNDQLAHLSDNEILLPNSSADKISLKAAFNNGGPPKKIVPFPETITFSSLLAGTL